MAVDFTRPLRGSRFACERPESEPSPLTTYHSEIGVVCEGCALAAEAVIVNDLMLLDFEAANLRRIAAHCRGIGW